MAGYSSEFSTFAYDTTLGVWTTQHPPGQSTAIPLGDALARRANPSVNVFYKYTKGDEDYVKLTFGVIMDHLSSADFFHIKERSTSNYLSSVYAIVSATNKGVIEMPVPPGVSLMGVLCSAVSGGSNIGATSFAGASYGTLVMDWSIG